MSLLDRLEKKLGHFAILGLIRYVVALTAATYVISLVNFSTMSQLILSGPLILLGEFWRLVTWPFLPPTITFFGFQLPIFVQVILMVFVLQCMWTFGEIIESSWGAFRLNLFFLTGMLGSIVAALIFRQTDTVFTAYLSTTILFAMATVAPDFQLLLYMILPVKVKWIAWIALAFLLLQLATDSWVAKACILLAFSNCLIFLCPAILRAARQSRDISARRAKFQTARVPVTEALHRCEVCSRTEITHPDLDFRVSSNGHEYCTEHLPIRKT